MSKNKLTILTTLSFTCVTDLPGRTNGEYGHVRLYLSYDADTNTLCSESLGATAYCGGIGFNSDYLLPTPEILEKSRLLLRDIIFKVIKAAEHRDVLTPANAAPDQWLRLLEPHRQQLT